MLRAEKAHGMSRFLYYPTKPWILTQGWGILNPSYNQFGFTRHNGQDSLPGADKLNHCPVRAKVEETGYNDAAGNYVRLVSTDMHMVGGVKCYVGMMFMHHEKILCVRGQILEIGEVMGIPDNTGFSTGAHTHGSYYRLSQPQNAPQYRLDQDTATNNTFDPYPYQTGVCAQDVGTYIGLLSKLVQLLQQAVNNH